MAWEGSTRRQRLPPDWKRRRQAVKQRADGRCEAATPQGRCPDQGADCDHIDRGDDHSLPNLQWLCHAHHKQKTAREAVAAQPRRKRPPAPHPGLTG